MRSSIQPGGCVHMPWVHSTFTVEEGGKFSAKSSKPSKAPASPFVSASTTGVA